MELMKNKYLIFEDIEFDDKILSNFSMARILHDIPEEYLSTENILQIKIEDDRYIEGISQDLYKNTNYWDLLMVINDMTRMDSLPVNYDMVLERVERKLEVWKEDLKMIYPPLSDTVMEEKEKDLTEKEIEINEKHRIFYYLSPSTMSDLLNYFEEQANKEKINNEILIRM